MKLFLILVAFAAAGTLGRQTTPSLDVDAIYHKAECAGQKLFQAMTTDANTAGRFITPVTSSFDGDMVAELRAWGYNDLSEDMLADVCEFQDHGISHALDALDIDSRPMSVGGPNACFHIEHDSGPTVLVGPHGYPPEEPISQQYMGPNGVRYRVTGAWATIGINPDSGMVYFFNRKAPFQAAIDLWTDRPNNPPLSNELPLLRSSSDITWGFWYRATRRKGNLQNIRYFMAVDIINEETDAIIRRALKYRKGSDDAYVQPWPGTAFVVNGDNEAMVLLGSPNGIGAGYFLAQHKAQLGGNKVISKITVFNGGLGELPNLLFWVADKPEEEEEPEHLMNTGRGADLETTVVQRKKDGKEILREHVFRAKL